MIIEESVEIQAPLRIVWRVFWTMEDWQSWNLVCENCCIVSGDGMAENTCFSFQMRPYYLTIKVMPTITNGNIYLPLAQLTAAQKGLLHPTLGPFLSSLIPGDMLASGLADGSALKEGMIESAAHMRLLTMGLVLLLVLRFSPRGLIPER